MTPETQIDSKAVKEPYLWRFVRIGGFDHVRLETGADLVHLHELDQKLWTALSCPTQGLEFDVNTLKLLDTDGDGRIRVPEILAAIRWMDQMLKNPDDLIRGDSTLALSEIDESHPEGRQLLSSARQILASHGKGDATVIGVEDTADIEKIFANMVFNGDGIIGVDATDDPALIAVIQDIMTCMGAVTDRGGAQGIDQERLDGFFEAATAYSQWYQLGRDDSQRLLPFGDATADVQQVFGAVKDKVEDFFTRCRLASFDPRAAEGLNPPLARYETITAKLLSASVEEIASLPLACITAEGKLPLHRGLNPAWADAVTRFSADIALPLFGVTDDLDAETWRAIVARFAAYENWVRDKQGVEVESLGIARIQEILAGNSRETIAALISRDKEFEPEAMAIEQVDRLVRYHRGLFQLLKNFVSFQDFYQPGQIAVFQAGTLYLDGRSCDLCVIVEDVDKHIPLATLSRIYLAYCRCRRRSGGETMTIVAAFTGGDADNLMVGRNGVFYDRRGGDWDATIVKIIENPISIRQAIWSPYKRAVRMIGEQIQKLSAAKDKSVGEKALSGVVKAAQKAKADTAKPAAAGPPAFDVAKFAGIFAAIGLALGAIGTAIASAVTGFFSLVWWKMPLAVVGLFLLISGPSMLLAWLKLRRRNLAPILDACGWAINTRARINLPFGTSLTHLAELPEGSERSMADPFAEKTRPWKWWILLLVIGLAAVVFFWYRGVG